MPRQNNKSVGFSTSHSWELRLEYEAETLVFPDGYIAKT